MAGLREGTNVFNEQKLCWKHRLREKKLLYAKYELVGRVFDRARSYLRDLKLLFRRSPLNISDFGKFVETITT